MKQRAGFTLIEVLVVLGILAFTIPAFLTISAYTTNMNNEARLRTGATLLAERVSEELVALSPSLRDPALQPGDLVHQDSDVEHPYNWDAIVAMSQEFPGQMEIIVTVSWQYNAKARSLEVATYGR